MNDRKSTLFTVLLLASALVSPAVSAQSNAPETADDPCAGNNADPQEQMHADLSRQLDREMDAQRSRRYADASRRAERALTGTAQARHEEIARSVAQRSARHLNEELVQMAAVPPAAGGDSNLARELPPKDESDRPGPAMPIVVSRAGSAEDGQIKHIASADCR
jgi:hypothetical protein